MYHTCNGQNNTELISFRYIYNFKSSLLCNHMHMHITYIHNNQIGLMFLLIYFISILTDAMHFKGHGHSHIISIAYNWDELENQTECFTQCSFHILIYYFLRFTFFHFDFYCHWEYLNVKTNSFWMMIFPVQINHSTIFWRNTFILIFHPCLICLHTRTISVSHYRYVRPEMLTPLKKYFYSENKLRCVLFKSENT